MRIAVAALAAVLLATPALAAKGAAPKGAAAEQAVRDPELASLRRQLAAATVVKRLQLTADQKKELLRVIDEARGIRAEAAKDPEIDAAQAARKDLLRKAIEETRANGEVSEKTKTALEESRESTQDVREDYRDRAQDLREQVKKILTQEQLDRVMAGGPVLHRKMKMQANAMPQRKMLIRLLLSDEFRDELSR